MLSFWKRLDQLFPGCVIIQCVVCVLRLTVRLAVGHPGPGRVVVVGVSLRVQVVKENIHLVWRQQLRRRLHVVVSQRRMVRVRMLSVQHRVMVHPAGLIWSHVHVSSGLVVVVWLSVCVCVRVRESLDIQEKEKKKVEESLTVSSHTVQGGSSVWTSLLSWYWKPATRQANFRR